MALKRRIKVLFSGLAVAMVLITPQAVFAQISDKWNPDDNNVSSIDVNVDTGDLLSKAEYHNYNGRDHDNVSTYTYAYDQSGRIMYVVEDTSMNSYFGTREGVESLYLYQDDGCIVVTDINEEAKAENKILSVSKYDNDHRVIEEDKYLTAGSFSKPSETITWTYSNLPDGGYKGIANNGDTYVWNSEGRLISRSDDQDVQFFNMHEAHARELSMIYAEAIVFHDVYDKGKLVLSQGLGRNEVPLVTSSYTYLSRDELEKNRNDLTGYWIEDTKCDSRKFYAFSANDMCMSAHVDSTLNLPVVDTVGMYDISGDGIVLSENENYSIMEIEKQTLEFEVISASDIMIDGKHYKKMG